MPAIRIKTSSGWQDIAIQGATGPAGADGVGAGGVGVPAQGATADFAYLITSFGSPKWFVRKLFIPMSIVIPGAITTGMAIPPVIIPQGISSAGQSALLQACHVQFLSGASSTFTVQATQNGNLIGGNVFVSTANTLYSINYSALQLSSQDRLSVAISGVTGSPVGLSVMFTINQTL
jgi:hypothetical protein